MSGHPGAHVRLGPREIIGALFNGIFLVVMAGYVFYMGAMRLIDPMELSTGVMLLAAAAIQMLCEIEGVRDVHHVHAWSLTSGRNLFSGPPVR